MEEEEEEGEEGNSIDDVTVTLIGSALSFAAHPVGQCAELVVWSTFFWLHQVPKANCFVLIQIKLFFLRNHIFICLFFQFLKCECLSYTYLCALGLRWIFLFKYSKYCHSIKEIYSLSVNNMSTTPAWQYTVL